eukprot:SAG22_NODE_168_length_16723_cov_6.542409_2_plen_738_part_00
MVDENAAHTYPSEWWQVSFTQAVGTIGHTALVLTPWRSPVPLRRAWCLWEIYSTLSEQAKLSVCMSDAQNKDFNCALVHEFGSVLESLCLIDAETAEAGSKKDLDMIFAAVRTLDGGFHTLNATVLAQMREMIFESLANALAATGLRFEALPVTYRIPCSASDDDPDEWQGGCEDLFEDGCGCHDDDDVDNRLQFGNWWRSETQLDICDMHYKELSKMQRRKFKPIRCAADLGDAAGKYKVVKFQLVGEVVGVNTSSVGSSLSVEAREAAATAASLLIQSTRFLTELDAEFDTAWDFEQAARKALALRRQLYGEQDLRTAEAIFDLSQRPLEGGDDEEYELLTKALAIRQALLPANDPSIAETLVGFGRFHEEQKEDAKEALRFYEQAVAIFEKNDTGTDDAKLHEAHGCPLDYVADALQELNRITEARRYFERAYASALNHHGERHISTATSANNLAVFYLSELPGEAFKAIPLLRQTLLTREIMFGADTAETAVSRKSLAEGLLDCVTLSNPSTKYAIGDRVQLIDNPKTCRKLAENSRTGLKWKAKMDKLCGQSGAVLTVEFNDDVRVLFDESWAQKLKEGKPGMHFHPDALKLIEKGATTAAAGESGGGLATLMADPLSTLSAAEAKTALEQEAEALLLRAMRFLEDNAGDDELVAGDAMTCAELLATLYKKQGRKKEHKITEKKKDMLKAWCEESSDSDDECGSDSDDSDDTGSDAGGGVDGLAQRFGGLGD